MSNGIVDMVHRAGEDHPEGPFYTLSEIAEYFERDKDTIKRWGAKIGVPTHKMPLGEGDSDAFVWCYTQADRNALEDYSATINPKGGRPKSEPED